MELPSEIRMPVKRRRRRSRQFKARVLEETLQGGVSVAAVARHHNLNANFIHKWRKTAQNGGPVTPAFIPLPAPPTPSGPSQHEVRVEVSTAQGIITLNWPGDQPASLAQFIKSLS